MSISTRHKKALPSFQPESDKTFIEPWDTRKARREPTRKVRLAVLQARIEQEAARRHIFLRDVGMWPERSRPGFVPPVPDGNVDKYFLRSMRAAAQASREGVKTIADIRARTLTMKRTRDPAHYSKRGV